MKMLIIAACLVVNEGVASHAEIGDTVDLSKDDALSLARMGRVLYLEKGDDPTKGTLTAGADDKARVKRQLEAQKSEHEQRAAAAQAASPAGMAALMAAAFLQAQQAAPAVPAKA